MNNISISWANQWGKVILLIAIITFIAHFWHYQSLGLYEDDYFLIGQPLSMNLDEAWEFIKWHIVNFNVTEGRPLLYIIEFFVGFLGNLIQNSLSDRLSSHFKGASQLCKSTTLLNPTSM